MSRGRPRTVIGGAAAIVGLAFLALLAPGCAPQVGGRLSLGGDPGVAAYLADPLRRADLAILGRSLPRGWTLEQPRATPGAGMVPSLILEWKRGEGLPGVLRKRYLAPAMPWREGAFDHRQAAAEEAGLVELGSLGGATAAVSVDGLFPGDSGYPFTENLLARLEGTKATALQAWLEGAGPALEALLKDLPGSDAPLAPPPYRLGAAGDMEVGPDEAPLLLGGEVGLKTLFGPALAFIRFQDLMVANLEAPLTAATEANPRKRFQFRYPRGGAAAMKAAGLDLVLFGNNHVLDFGEAGFRDSLAELREAGLPFVGAGEDGARALASVDLDPPRGGPALRFIGFGSFPSERYGFTTAEAAAGPAKGGINADLEATLGAIRQGVGQGKTVVVLAHGGAEYQFEPTAEIQARYRQFIDSGAILVLGSHPHLLQGVEAYRGGLIAYSLGNFLFTGEAEPEAALASGAVSLLVYKGRVRGLSLSPFRVAITGDLEAGDGARAIREGFAARTDRLNP